MALNRSNDRPATCFPPTETRRASVLRGLLTSLAALLLALGLPAASSAAAPAGAPGTAAARSAPPGLPPAVNGPSQARVAEEAYPRPYVSAAQALAARRAYLSLPGELGRSAFRSEPAAQAYASARPAPVWQELGPVTPFVPSVVNFGFAPTTNSGRITALAVDPACGRPFKGCRVWIAAAGGGVWRTDNALSASPSWTPSSNGLPSNAIGSLVVDGNGGGRQTLYAGTGEPNGSDSQAGVGLFRSNNGGRSWRAVPGSFAVAHDRSIGAIAVDPRNRRTIYIGTDVALHGDSSVAGGAATPPGAPKLGLYKSTDGGRSFSLVFALPGRPVIPLTGQLVSFRAGVNDLELDPADPETVYVSLFGYGIWRSSPRNDGTRTFKQVFATRDPSNYFGDRTQFALTRKSGRTRIYSGDGSSSVDESDNVSVLWRTDDADRPAAELTRAGANSGWIRLSSAVRGTPGFSSYNYCQSQCTYDNVVAVDPSNPDDVWLGGATESFVFGGPLYSNGRSALRSTDGGVTFADETLAPGETPESLHPDLHAIAFARRLPGVALIGTDGGLFRTTGRYVDVSDDAVGCRARGLTGDDLVDCERFLSAVPQRLLSLNDGLRTIQFQSLSVNERDPLGDLLGGTQDNGTWAFTGSPTWFETDTGDGGQSAIDPVQPRIRVHTFGFGATPSVNFRGSDPRGWNFIGDPLETSKERASFYVPLIADPRVSRTLFVGLQHVWRTKDSGGPQASLESNCNQFATGAPPPEGVSTGVDETPTVTCGDWRAIGPDLTSPAFGDRAGEYVVATERARSDGRTLWAATRLGRVFVSSNARARPRRVLFRRIDGSRTPRRFVSSISIDPADPGHAWISYSGYDAYTPTTPGHVFEFRLNPVTGETQIRDLSFDLGDVPLSDLERDDATGDLYAATDFGVARLPAGTSSWQRAGSGLPPVAVAGLTLPRTARVLYAATHGRGAWRLALGTP